MIDATIVRAHQHSAGARKKRIVNQAIGRSRGGLTTKIHMVVDALGNPLAFSLTGGQVNDITQAETLTAKIAEPTLLPTGLQHRQIRCEPRGPRDQAGYPAQSESQSQTRLRFRPLRRAQSGRTILPIHQTIPRYSHPLRKDRPQFPRSIATRLRAGLAQMRTRPSGSTRDRRSSRRRPTPRPTSSFAIAPELMQPVGQCHGFRQRSIIQPQDRAVET